MIQQVLYPFQENFNNNGIIVGVKVLSNSDEILIIMELLLVLKFFLILMRF
jgi:hypothetical protein